jgi:MinD-like ATPase involved in chromosome partitioning or flagellar assembly
VGLYAVCAAKGSPGVSTAAVALALTWGTPAVVADLDPAGGDLALRYRDDAGRPLDPDRGLLSLAAAVRRGSEGADVGEHLQSGGGGLGGLPLLVGVSRPEQVTALGTSWQYVAHSLATLPGHDVLADCGRVLPGSATMPVLTRADAILILTRPSLEELYHLRERLRALTQTLRLEGLDAVPVGVAVLASERDRDSVRDVQQVITAAGLPAKVVGAFTSEPKTASAVRYGLDVSPRKSLLLRSAAAIGDALRALAKSREIRFV